jgi:hypothetical protein
MRRGAKRGVRRDELLPTPERLNHGDVIRPADAILDAQGGLVRPYRGLDTLERMQRAGTINERERLAGNRFHDLFRHAMLDRLRATDPTRIPISVLNGSGTRAGAGWAGEGNEGARLAVLSALDALGGVQSIGGSCAWHVLGCEMTIVTWALTISSTGRRMNKHTASGVLLTDLQQLQAHFGC